MKSHRGPPDPDSDYEYEGYASGAGSCFESGSKDQPTFLRKLYTILESCPPEIAAWSDKGDSFIIYDPDAFAAEIIPRYYAHNNFASFVRQCNFYSFKKVSARKVKNEMLAQPLAGKSWEFKHEKFLRGKPHLLSQIRRATHGSNASEQEVTHLKSELGHMKERMETMQESICQLTELVNGLMIDKVHRDQQHQCGADLLKKRKTSDVAGPLAAQNVLDPSKPELKCEFPGGFTPFHGPELPAAMVGDGVGETDPLPPLADMLEPSQGSDVPHFPLSHGEDGDDLSLSSLLSFDGLDLPGSPMRPSTPERPSISRANSGVSGVVPAAAAATISSADSCSPSRRMAMDSVLPPAAPQADYDDKQLQSLTQALTSLSPELQRKLVETLLVSIQTSSSSATAGTAITAPLATGRSQMPLSLYSSSMLLPPPPSHHQPPHMGAVALPFASAAVGALLTEYARQLDPIPKAQVPPSARKAIRTQG